MQLRQHLANGAFRFRKLTRPINRRDENMLNHYEKGFFGF